MQPSSPEAERPEAQPDHPRPHEEKIPRPSLRMDDVMEEGGLSFGNCPWTCATITIPACCTYNRAYMLAM